MTQVTETTTLAKQFEKQPVLGRHALGRSEFRDGSVSQGNRKSAARLSRRHLCVFKAPSSHWEDSFGSLSFGNILKRKLRALRGGELISPQLCELQLSPMSRNEEGMSLSLLDSLGWHLNSLLHRM